jgi:hypothetical protein
VVDIRDVVQVREVTSGWVDESSRWKVCAEYVDHGNSLGLSHEQWPCFGYRLEAIEAIRKVKQAKGVKKMNQGLKYSDGIAAAEALENC